MAIPVVQNATVVTIRRRTFFGQEEEDVEDCVHGFENVAAANKLAD